MNEKKRDKIDRQKNVLAPVSFDTLFFEFSENFLLNIAKNTCKK